jgi:hypothetical protein
MTISIPVDGPGSSGGSGGGSEGGGGSSGNETLPANIIESVAVGALAANGGQPAALSNLATSNGVTTSDLSHKNALANQQQMSKLGLAIVGTSVRKVGELGPLEARSGVEVLSGDELAQTILELKATLAALAGPGPSSPSPAPSPGPEPSGPKTPPSPATPPKSGSGSGSGSGSSASSGASSSGGSDTSGTKTGGPARASSFVDVRGQRSARISPPTTVIFPQPRARRARVGRPRRRGR